jgi:hypothetical protein
VTAPGGAEQLVAFASILCLALVVVGAVGYVCATLIGRAIERALREVDARRSGEVDALAERWTGSMRDLHEAWARTAAERDRVLLDRLRVTAAERRRVRGFLGCGEDDPPRGEGASGVVIRYEPSGGDDVTVGRERARG